MGKDSIVERASWLLESSGDSAYITSPEGTIEYVNPAFEAMSGFGELEAIGRTPAIVKSGVQSDAFYRDMWSTLHAGHEFHGVLVNRRRDGSLFHEEKTIRPLFDEAGRIAHYLSCGRNVSERLELQDLLQHQATHDALTGLPNRLLFTDRLERAIAQAERTGESFTVAMVDLDGFKAINDRHGHAAGDEALKDMAQRLTGCVREADTVARWGGDEFALLLRDAGDTDRVMSAIVEAGRQPSASSDRALRLSLGACRFPEGGRSAESLLQTADGAMYQAKRDGGDRYRWAMREHEAPVVVKPTAGEAAAIDALRLLEGKVPMFSRRLRAGDTLYRAGDKFRDLHILRFGLCKLMSVTAEGHEELSSMVFKGDWLGFDGLADGRHGCSAVAADTGEVWTVRYDALILAGVRNPALLGAMHAAMARQSAREREAVVTMHSLPADGRVAAFLCRWADDLDHCGMRNDHITLPTTRAEIGGHVGLRLESVSRAMAALERGRLIRFASGNRRNIEIPDLPALRRYVREASASAR
ncbi:diguanylate cyclase domain-containing protein [Piscinibacter gummiphilus]|uniref:Diguanylate cyclase n=1 Tax=Piscinibacter gummiphilus TaxID=946333 RepID=A0ABZ0D093_9BURK|nr:diguanylate cyclase [Piscinibacter gummiphilus]WOB10624.1 diguanylate cyclase [Piscinibacter gummiphilus]